MIVIIDPKEGYIAPSNTALNDEVLLNINNSLGKEYSNLAQLSTDTELLVDGINMITSQNMANIQKSNLAPFAFLNESKFNIEHHSAPTYEGVKNNFRDLCLGLNLVKTATPGISNLYFDSLLDYGQYAVPPLTEEELSDEQKANKDKLNTAFKNSEDYGIHHEGNKTFQYKTIVDSRVHDFKHFAITSDDYTYLDLSVRFTIKESAFAPNLNDLTDLVLQRMIELCTIGQNFYADAIVSSTDFPTISNFFIYSRLVGETGYTLMDREASNGQRFYVNSIEIAIQTAPFSASQESKKEDSKKEDSKKEPKYTVLHTHKVKKPVLKFKDREAKK